MFEALSDPAIWAGLATLTAMEIVLGIDNIVFITILANKLPEDKRGRARNIGLGLAAFTRIGMIFGIAFLVQLTEPLFEIFSHPFSGRDLILLGGGLFLMYKAVKEIHEKLEGDDLHGDQRRKRVTFSGVIVQILMLDIIFSLDAVITAVGMVDQIWIMVVAMLIALGVMILSGRSIGEFVHRHPTVKMLALSFLLLIGVTLSAEAFHQNIPKGYIYSAMAFSILVETLNLMATNRKKRKRGTPTDSVNLRKNVVGMEIEEN
jgi:predicted tellurium resistance membrane protein TerC